MKLFSVIFLTALWSGVVFSRALPEESAVPAEKPSVAPAETVTTTPTAPAETTPAVQVQPTPSSPKPPKGSKPGKEPEPPKDATIAEAEELERKLEKALKESRGILGRFSKLTKIKDELLAKAKAAKKKGKRRLRRALIRNVIKIIRLKIRISKLK